MAALHEAAARRGHWPRAGAVALLVGATAIAGSPPALAEEAESEDIARARELYTEGLDAARAGSWEPARIAFERSFEISPRASTLLNLAGAQAETDRLVEAVASYRRFIMEAPGTPAARHLDAARDALRGVEARVPRLRIYVVGSSVGDLVYLDGEVVATDDGAVHYVDAGDHSVEVRQGETVRAFRRLSVVEGQDDQVVIALGPSGMPVEPTSTAPPMPLESESPEERAAPGRAMRTSGIVLFSLAGASLATCVGLVMWADALYQDWEAEDVDLRRIYRLAADDPMRPPAELIEARQDDNDEMWSTTASLTTASYCMLGLGVAALAVAFGVYFGAPSDEAPTVSLLPHPGGAMLTVPFSLL